VAVPLSGGVVIGDGGDWWCWCTDGGGAPI